MVLGSGQLSGLSGAAPRSDRSVESNELTEQDFLTLIVAQMRNQNPLDPQGQEDFIAQMTQFTMLDQMRAMNETMTFLLVAGSFSQASSLIGKSVRVTTDDANQADSVVAGLTSGNPGALSRIEGVPPDDAVPGEWAITTSADGKVEAVFTPAAGGQPTAVSGEFSEQGILTGMIPGITLLERLVHSGGTDRIVYAPATEGIVDRVRMRDGAPELLVNGKYVRMSEVLEVGLAGEPAPADGTP